MTAETEAALIAASNAYDVALAEAAVAEAAVAAVRSDLYARDRLSTLATDEAVAARAAYDVQAAAAIAAADAAAVDRLGDTETGAVLDAAQQEANIAELAAAAARAIYDAAVIAAG